MNRTLFSLFALAVVLAAGVPAVFAQVAPPTHLSCCTAGDGDYCCGKTGCSADATSCEAW